MSDVEQYMNGRKQTKLEYTVGFEEGNRDFEIDVLLRQIRKKVGLTQEQSVICLKGSQT